LLRRLSRKTQKNKIKKKFFFIFFICTKIFFYKKKIFLFERSPWGGGFIEDEAPWTIFPEDCTKRHSELAERSETFHYNFYKHFISYIERVLSVPA
jgi:hypothetical protein